MGRAFVFGDGITTDYLAPGNRMKLPPEELARYCMNAIDPEFAQTVQFGDVVFAGKNFGQGSSRDQAVTSLQLLGVSAVVATSFARIFYRNAMNLGLPLITLDPTGRVSTGDEVEINFSEGHLANVTAGETFEFQKLPSHLMKILDAGGLIPLLEERIQVDRAG